MLTAYSEEERQEEAEQDFCVLKEGELVERGGM